MHVLTADFPTLSLKQLLMPHIYIWMGNWKSNLRKWFKFYRRWWKNVLRGGNCNIYIFLISRHHCSFIITTCFGPYWTIFKWCTYIKTIKNYTYNAYITCLWVSKQTWLKLHKHFLQSAETLHNPGTGWVATDPAFTHKSTHFLFHALRDRGKHWYEFSSTKQIKGAEDFPPQAMLFELTTE
jgi:hypothetical protein